MSSNMEIIVATNNAGKIKEIKKILEPIGIKALSLDDINLDIDVVEDRDTLEGNAEKKATEIMEIVGKPVLADDSGLFVDALDGRPGVYSKRYAGGDSHQGNLKLLAELEGVPEEKRTAHFKSVICLAFPGESVLLAEGKLEGLIQHEEKGSNGFGYDPIFYLPQRGITLAEASNETKNQISHRALALEKLKETLLDRL
ncbi:RdgB/HAM1 family non-canonical purine NTP pyrophosphatase [Bacillus horti]|uniref:dITP/XTP pyrophosphatase n=1 Tax=Caldalkalibacillus horti TaxID=77523 RepID=A0ABT9W1Z8_9BACI|nr:RdgB/HAM1 family non-canonical purine NTP pyrophosphatase [Bacillus horti]MDQ0167135.1 XTP/dITP diphosphohydrolase [Bacillus horti]